MEYKGLTAAVRFITTAGVYVGELENTREVVAFTAATLPELREAMVSAVESFVGADLVAKRPFCLPL